MRKKRKQKQKRRPRNEPSPYAGMTKSERARAIGRLGGLARAAKLTPTERTRISIKGGMVTYLRYGEEHYSKAAKNAWNKLTEEEKKAKIAKLDECRKKIRGE